MEQPIGKLWTRVRERRRESVLRALKRLVASKVSGIEQYLPPALLFNTELTCAMKVGKTELESSWILVQKDHWYPFGAESIYPPDMNGRSAEYIFVQVDWINKPKIVGKMNDIQYFEASDTKQLMDSLGRDFKIRQYVALSLDGSIDGWILYRYAGGTNEGILIFEEGRLKEIRKRPFGYTLDDSIMLRDEDIQEYRNLYNHERGHYPTGEFDPWGSHSEEVSGFAYRYEELKGKWRDYLWEAGNSRKILIEFRKSPRIFSQELRSETETEKTDV